MLKKASGLAAHDGGIKLRRQRRMMSEKQAAEAFDLKQEFLGLIDIHLRSQFAHQETQGAFFTQS